MNNSLLVVLIASGIAYGTPLLYAALGELLAERSGVLNLGVEGMMLVGAVMGFWTVQNLHVTSRVSLAAAIVVAGIAGALMALILAFLVITLRASQIVSGLALTIFAGAAGLFVLPRQRPRPGRQPCAPPVRGVIPREHAGVARDRPDPVRPEHPRVPLVAVRRRRVPLPRADSAGAERPRGRRGARRGRAMGINVVGYRYAHTLVGGAFAGVAGATVTLAITPQWVDGITGGAGWIAIALVIFAFWRPLCLVGAYFFGALQALAPELQARSINIGPTVLWTNALPYVMTIVVLVVASATGARRRLGAPAALGTPYVREER